MTHSIRARRSLSSASLTKHYERFLRSLRRKRPETRGTYGRALREFLRWTSRKRTFLFSSNEVERYKRHLSGKKKLSPVSISTYLTALRRFCDFLLRSGVIPANPALSVGGNSRPRLHTRKSLSSAEVESLLACVERLDERGARDYAFIKLMAGCALSEIELIRADVVDLSLNEGSTILRVQGKGRVRKDEAVQLPVDVRRAVEAYLALRGNVNTRDPLFTSAGNRTRGKRMTTRGVRDRVNMHLTRSGLKKGTAGRVSPYSLRHTAAVLMAGAGASADEIRVRMRLGSVATAMLYINEHNEQVTG